MSSDVVAARNSYLIPKTEIIHLLCSGDHAANEENDDEEDLDRSARRRRGASHIAARRCRWHNSDKAAIERLLRSYEQALNAGDTDVVVRLYAPDGVFMPQHSPSSVGAEAVRAAYVNVFDTITLNVRFNIAEIVQVAPEWAFARTNSAGTVTVKAIGRTGPEANQEVFVLRKLGSGEWKIARYCFSTTNPPRG